MTESRASVPRKDPAEEDFLLRLNDVLVSMEEADFVGCTERFPTLQVIGVPRSGTTLATQIVARHLDIGYINNLIAAFWRAPTVGIRLSRKLLRKGMSSSFVSTFGGTSGIEEPHEFGYFWRELLGYQDLSDRGEEFAENIDWARVRTMMNKMTHAFERPVMFKSFWLSMHIAKTLSVLPRTCFVRIRRDRLENALSLLKLRQGLAGSPEQWVSMKPREYEQLSSHELPVQLAGQVFFLERMMDQGISAVGGKNVLEVAYEDMCDRPAEFLDRVSSLLKENGFDPARRSHPISTFEVTRPSRSADPVLISGIRRAFELFESGRWPMPK
jgi:hypothetical protein